MMEVTLREAVEYMDKDIEIIVETADGHKYIPNDSSAYFQLKDIATAKFFKHLSKYEN